jgi:uncharacterized membrane protein YdjX (TVP38/TMEM64 family)
MARSAWSGVEGPRSDHSESTPRMRRTQERSRARDGYAGGVQPQSRKVVLGAVTLAVLAGAAQWARSAYGLEWSPASLRDVVKEAGIWGPIVFILLLSLRPILVIPSQLLLISAGVCFGTFEGALYAALGITLGGVFAFALTRWMGREAVLAHMPPGVRHTLDSGGRTAVPALLFLGTAYPIGPILWLAVGAALTGIALPSFVVSLFAGGFIRATTYAFFGSSLVDADLYQIVLGAIAIGAVALLPLLHPRVRTTLWRMIQEE